MTTEAMLRELEKVMREVKQADESQSDYDMAWAGDDAFCFLRTHGTALLEAVRDAKSHVVVTRDSTGEIVAVTRQDDEGRILGVIAEKFTDDERHAFAVEAFVTQKAIDQARAEGGSITEPGATRSTKSRELLPDPWEE